MSDDISIMTCDWCGKEFPADARACVEGGIEGFPLPEIVEGEEWKEREWTPVDPASLTKQQLEQIKTEMGLDDAQLEELLHTGSVKGIGGIICLECQDNAETTELP